MEKTGINIFSGAKDWLGAALTNPTHLAVQKGALSFGYPIHFAGRRFSDVEGAYHFLATPVAEERDQLMAELICAKFRQHSALLEAVELRGGREFLKACSHWTGAKSEQAQSWEGQGEDSRFIRNLLRGYDLLDFPALTQVGQQALF